LITPLGHLELLRRLGAAPLEPLVDVLRDLHQRGATDSKELQALLAPSESLVPAAPADPPAIEMLRQPDHENYEAARKHFVQHAERLREQALLAERLLEGFARTEAANGRSPLHRELTLACVRGGTSGTRFIVGNSLRQPVTVGFHVGRIHGYERPSASEIVTFDPPAPRLSVGDEQVVRVVVDLRQHDIAGDAFEFGVDVLGDERLLVRLWIRVRVTDQERLRDERAKRV
jgi:hypothetical protein